jgi:hypothetical protein
MSVDKGIIDRHREMVAGSGLSAPLAAGATSWLLETATSGDQTVWERLIGNHNAIANSARAPTAQADSSLAFTATTPDVMAWEITGANFSTDYLAIYFWVKPTGVVGQQLLWSQHLGTGGASARSLEIYSNGTELRVEVYASVNHGRRHTFNSYFAAGAPRMVGFEFNKDGSGDGRVVVTRNAVVLVADAIVDLSATPQTPAILVNVTGNILLGNFNDSAVASRAYGGQYGRSLVVRSGSKMSGVTTTGVLTQPARNALLGFVPLV